MTPARSSPKSTWTIVLDSAEQDRMREQLSLEKAQSKLNVLDNYRKPRTLIELRTEVERKRVGRTGQAAAV